MKKTLMLFVSMTALWCANGDPLVYTEYRYYSYRVGNSWGSSNMPWTYLISDGKAQVGDGTKCAISSISYPLDLEIQSLVNGYPVLNIASNAFAYCPTVGSMIIPHSVRAIGASAFAWCTDMYSVTIPITVRDIADDAFCGCIALTEVTIPASVTNIGDCAFADCICMTNMTFNGDMPNFGEDVFDGTPEDMTLSIGKNANGWDYYEKHGLTPPWGDRTVIRLGGSGVGRHDNADVISGTNITLTITNVVIHYIVNSVQPEKAIPASMDAGFVNIITEVKSGGAVSVPATWMVNYPNYIAKFGNDFTKSLMKTTGKKDGMGNAMMVWQDYVAGTDPTDTNDVFTASITLVEGVPKISYSPEFKDAGEASLRKYTVYGKKNLMDSEWQEVEPGEELDYNFYRVTVRMK